MDLDKTETYINKDKIDKSETINNDKTLLQRMRKDLRLAGQTVYQIEREGEEKYREIGNTNSSSMPHR